MSARSHNGALIAGLILIGVGIIFLFENWYLGFSLWRILARYWPPHHQCRQWPNHHAAKPAQNRRDRREQCPLATIACARRSVREGGHHD